MTKTYHVARYDLGAFNAPQLPLLLKEREALKARFDCSDAAWAELFAIEAKIRELGGQHLIGTTYDDGR